MVLRFGLRLMDKDWRSHFLSNYHGSTLGSYSNTLNRFPCPDIKAVTSQDVRQWLDDLDCEISTKQKHLNCLRTFFNWLVRQGAIERTPTPREFKLPRCRDALNERILTPQEVADFLEALHRDTRRSQKNCDRNYLFFKVIYYLGLRISEATRLRWRDFNRDGSQVSIFGKGGKTRIVAVPVALWEELSQWAVEKRGYVFTSETGKLLTRDQLHKIIKTAAAAAGIENAEYVSAHWLRHSHATHALKGGAPIHLVQKSLGHASLETTGRYLHVTGGESSSNYLGI